MNPSPILILRLTPKTAALVGETLAEWQLLEKQVRAGRWAYGPRTEEGRLRQLAVELGVPVREEGVGDGNDGPQAAMA
jgi:hypothetical protein